MSARVGRAFPSVIQEARIRLEGRLSLLKSHRDRLPSAEYTISIELQAWRILRPSIASMLTNVTNQLETPNNVLAVCPHYQYIPVHLSVLSRIRAAFHDPSVTVVQSLIE